jgi:UDP-N-acetylmuramoyl-L-alanyl-D-glutamate--2,6-diaminopimelate ligase
MAAKMRLFDTLLPKGAPAVIFADDPWSERAVELAANGPGAGADRWPQGRLPQPEARRASSATSRSPNSIMHGGDFRGSDCRWPAISRFPTRWFRPAWRSPRAPWADQAMAALEHLTGASGRLELVGHRPARVRRPMSIMRTSPKRWKTCSMRCVRSPPAASSWCSVAAETATAANVRSWAIATRLADVVIVTDDNPRSEEPASIRAEIMAAAPGATEIADRARRHPHGGRTCFRPATR